jgi:hypothetical protein
VSARPELRASNVTLDFEDATVEDMSKPDILGRPVDDMVHVFDMSTDRRRDVTYVSFGETLSTVAITGRRETVRWLLTEALRQLDELEAGQ